MILLMILSDLGLLEASVCRALSPFFFFFPPVKSLFLWLLCHWHMVSWVILSLTDWIGPTFGLETFSKIEMFQKTLPQSHQVVLFPLLLPLQGAVSWGEKKMYFKSALKIRPKESSSCVICLCHVFVMLHLPRLCCW